MPSKKHEQALLKRHCKILEILGFQLRSIKFKLFGLVYSVRSGQ